MRLRNDNQAFCYRAVFSQCIPHASVAQQVCEQGQQVCEQGQQVCEQGHATRMANFFAPDGDVGGQEVTLRVKDTIRNVLEVCSPLYRLWRYFATPTFCSSEPEGRKQRAKTGHFCCSMRGLIKTAIARWRRNRTVANNYLVPWRSICLIAGSRKRKSSESHRQVMNLDIFIVVYCESPGRKVSSKPINCLRLSSCRQASGSIHIRTFRVHSPLATNACEWRTCRQSRVKSFSNDGFYFYVVFFCGI